MVILLAALSLAASPNALAARAYKLLGRPNNIVCPNIEACERARQALERENAKRLTEDAPTAQPNKPKETRWIIEPACLPW